MSAAIASAVGGFIVGAAFVLLPLQRHRELRIRIELDASDDRRRRAGPDEGGGADGPLQGGGAGPPP